MELERLDARASGRIRLTGLLGAGAMHAAAWFWVVSYQAPVSAQIAQAPIMVSLITAPEIKIASPEPEKVEPPPKLKPRPPVQKQKPPLLATKSETPVVEEAPAPEPPPPPVAATAPPREEAPAPPIIPPRFNADYLQNPRPPYPSMSRRLREEGTVMLRVLVSATGLPERVELNKSSGSARLDQSALETVQQRWKFTPARQGNMPTEAWVLIPISFSLEG